MATHMTFQLIMEITPNNLQNLQGINQFLSNSIIIRKLTEICKNWNI